MMKRFLFGAAMLLAGSAFAQQRVPEIRFTSVPDYPNLPAGMNLGEVPGVAVNSSGHVFVFSRSNSANGPAFGAAAAQLFEFDQNGNFVREIGKGHYAWSEAHSVRIDRNNNIWAIDKGSNMVVRFNPQGPTQVLFVGESTYPGRIFKVALDGTVLGVIGRSRRNLGQFSGAHALACPSERELYVGETSNWRVQKLLLR
jgi:hypothetical protein